MSLSRVLRHPLRAAALGGCARQQFAAFPRIPILVLNVEPKLGRATRQLHSSAVRRQEEPATPSRTELKEPSSVEVYYGPLAPTWRKLKIFSVGSFTLSTLMTPLMFMIETTSAVPLVARVAMACTIIATSGVSTALVTWCSKPYVHKLHYFRAEDPDAPIPSQAAGKEPTGMELVTTTLTLRKRITRVYDTAFLVPTSRPFAKWELAEAFQLPLAEAEAEKAKGNLPREETIAETLDESGHLVGRWIVKWDEHGAGTCHQAGKVQRYFNVHEELLSRPPL